MSEVIEDHTRIQITTSGQYEGRNFAVVGRIQLRYEDGFWNEWYVLFDDGTLPNKLAALRSRGEYWGELIVAPEEGEERTAALMARSFIRDNRRFFVAMLHDITEQKSLQEASRIANLQLEQINETLQQVNAMRMAFFTDISQRLRSPLSAIVGFNEMLLNEELGEVNPEQRQALQSCRRSLQRVFELANEATSLGEPVLPEDVRTPETTPR